MNNKIVIGLAFIAACLSFIAWTYVYNGVFGFFITPDDPAVAGDNFARLAQVIGSVIFGGAVLGVGMEEVTKKENLN